MFTCDPYAAVISEHTAPHPVVSSSHTHVQILPEPLSAVKDCFCFVEGVCAKRESLFNSPGSCCRRLFLSSSRFCLCPTHIHSTVALRRHDISYFILFTAPSMWGASDVDSISAQRPLESAALGF